MLYDNAWPSTYEEIKSFYPVWYWDVFEMDAIWRAQGYEMDNVRRTIERVIDDGYIDTADSDMIAQYEHFLDLPTDKTVPLEERRKIVSATLFLILHIGAPEIKEILGIFTDSPVTVTFANGKIGIIVESGRKEPPGVDACDALLRKRIPAHLALDLCVHIQQSFRETLHICCGSAVWMTMDAEPANDDRMTAMPLQISHGGLLTDRQQFIPPNEIKEATGRSGHSVGAYYHTHIKSKLIE